MNSKDDLPPSTDTPEPILCQRCGRGGATMCRLYGRKRPPLIIALCDPCSNHFLMLDWRTGDVECLKTEMEKRLQELEELHGNNAGRGRKRKGTGGTD